MTASVEACTSPDAAEPHRRAGAAPAGLGRQRARVQTELLSEGGTLVRQLRGDLIPDRVERPGVVLEPASACPRIECRTPSSAMARAAASVSARSRASSSVIMA
jgi:hypothetical protein